VTGSPSHPPDSGDRNHIGRSTRSAFTTPGSSSIGYTMRSPFTEESNSPRGLDDPADPTRQQQAEPPRRSEQETPDLPASGSPSGPLPGAAEDPPTTADPGAAEGRPLEPPPIPPPIRTVHIPTGRGVPRSFRVLRILLGAWLVLVILSILVPALTPRTGDGFTRGINRLYSFFGYQATAGILAFVIAYLARSSRSISKRWAILGLVPLGLTCLLVLGIIALFVFARH